MVQHRVAMSNVFRATVSTRFRGSVRALGRCKWLRAVCMATPTLVTNTGGKCGATLVATKFSGGIRCTSTTRDISLHWAHSRKVYVGTERQASEWATIQYCENKNNRQSNIIKDIKRRGCRTNARIQFRPRFRTPRSRWKMATSLVNSGKTPHAHTKKMFPNEPFCIIFVASEHHTVGGQLLCSNLRGFASESKRA